MSSIRVCVEHVRGALLLGLLALCLGSNAAAQSTTDGAIGGTLTEQTGSVIQGATISAVNMGTNSKSTATTDGSGRYLIIHLQPGIYSVEASATGFSVFKQTNVTVEVGRITTIDMRLTLAGQTETVTATAEAPVIDTQQPDFATNINQVSMNELPVNGRRWSTFALQTPGAVPDGNFGLVSFRGVSGLLNNNTVDGGDNNQAFFAEERGRTRIGYSVSQASIQEFQVNTSNYSAEYGRSAGGVVNAVTKSGTNNFHGQGFYFIRDNALGAYNPFAVQTVLNSSGVPTRIPIKPEDRRHQFGAAVGGPIVRERLFFFFSYDQQKRNFPGVASPGSPSAFFSQLNAGEMLTLSQRGITPAQQNAGLQFLQSLTGTVPRKGDQTLFFPKIDWKITNSHTLTVSYNRLRWNSPAGIQTGAVIFRGVESFGNDFVKEDWGIAKLISTFSTSLSNEFRFQYGRDFEYQNTQAPVQGEPVSQSGFSPQIGISGGGGLTFGKPNFLDRRAYPSEKRTQFADTLAMSFGRHLIKAGTDINRANDLLDSLFQEGGAYSYGNRVQFISDYAAFVNKFAQPACQAGTPPVQVPCYSSYNQGFGPAAFQFATNDLAFFVQDAYRIRPRLTINAGLRWEYEMLPTPQIPNPALPATSSFPDDKRNFGPRIGAAWDLTGQGKTVLRGGYGIYYGRIINSTISNAITNTGVSTGQLQFTFLPTAAGAPRYPNIITTAASITGNPPDVVVFAPNTRMPKIHQFDLVLEHQIATNTAISVTYLGSLGRNLPQFLDTNLPTTAPSTLTWNVTSGPFAGQSFVLPFYGRPRPNPAFGRITAISDIVSSKYNAVVFQFNRRLTNGLQFQTSYTYSRVSDRGQSSQTFTSGNNVLDVNNLALEAGRSNFDVRHHFGANAIWQPNYFGSTGGIPHALLDGFTISPVVLAASGVPYTPTLPFISIGGAIQTGILGAGGTNRPPWVPRNGYQMPRIVNVDLRISRRFAFGERISLEVLGEAFNLFNHVNATSVDDQIYNASITLTQRTLSQNDTFNTVQGSSNSLLSQRQIQLGLRVHF